MKTIAEGFMDDGLCSSYIISRYIRSGAEDKAGDCSVFSLKSYSLQIVNHLWRKINSNNVELGRFVQLFFIILEFCCIEYYLKWCTKFYGFRAAVMVFNL